MYLLFNTDLPQYSSLSKTLLTGFEVIIGDRNTEDLERSHSVLGPAWFSAYCIIILFFALNIFISIIVESFEIVKQEAKDSPENFDFLEHVWVKLKDLLTRKSSKEQMLTPSDYKDHLSIFSERINRLCNYTLRVNVSNYYYLKIHNEFFNILP